MMHQNLRSKFLRTWYLWINVYVYKTCPKLVHFQVKSSQIQLANTKSCLVLHVIMKKKQANIHQVDINNENKIKKQTHEKWARKNSNINSHLIYPCCLWSMFFVDLLSLVYDRYKLSCGELIFFWIWISFECGTFFLMWKIYVKKVKCDTDLKSQLFSW